MSRLSFTEALDQALELLEQGHPLEYCVRQFPEYADELRPLLQVSDDLHRLASAPLPILEKVSAEPDWETILAQIPQDQPGLLNRITTYLSELVKRLHVPSGPRYASLVAALLIVLVLGWHGSQQSTPDSPLYSIKRAVEQVEMVAALDPTARVELHIELARRRFDELHKLATQTRRIEQPLLNEALSQTREAVAVAKQAGVGQEMYSELSQLLSEADLSIDQLKDKVAEPTAEGLDNAGDTVSQLRDDLERVGIAEAATATPTIAPTQTPATPTRTATPIPTPTATSVRTPTPTATPDTDDPEDVDQSVPVRSPTATTVVPRPTQTAVPTSEPIISVPPMPTTPPVAPVPTEIPMPLPTRIPVEIPTLVPTQVPTAVPTRVPTEAPTDIPTAVPTEIPTPVPTEVPTPTDVPTEVPTPMPTEVPTEAPTPTDVPTEVPTDVPTEVPTEAPTPTDVPTEVPTPMPTEVPTDVPTDVPTEVPTETASPIPTVQITVTIIVPDPTQIPVPTEAPSETPAPIVNPTELPTEAPTVAPTAAPIPAPAPTATPGPVPTETTGASAASIRSVQQRTAAKTPRVAKANVSRKVPQQVYGLALQTHKTVDGKSSAVVKRRSVLPKALTARLEAQVEGMLPTPQLHIPALAAIRLNDRESLSEP